MRRARGFSLMEIVVVTLIIGVLFVLGAAKYSAIATEGRLKGCVSNQNAVLLSINSWEARSNVTMGDGTVDVSVKFNQKGVVTAGSNQPSQLPVGSAEIAQLVGNLDLFVCPERAKIAGGYGRLGARAGENYEFLFLVDAIGNARGAEISHKKRGVACIFFGKQGPDKTTETVHRP